MLGDPDGSNLVVGHGADFHIGLGGQSREIGYPHRKKASDSDGYPWLMRVRISRGPS
jgi:hypothetical protein